MFFKVGCFLNCIIFIVLQTSVLEKLTNMNPDVHWWLKGDGIDIVKGLWQSAAGEWSGDVD